MGNIYFVNKDEDDDCHENHHHQKKPAIKKPPKQVPPKNNNQKDNDKDKKDECKDCKNEHDKNCKGCICNIINNFVEKQVFFRTKSGDILEGTVKAFDEDNCCVTIESQEMMSPNQPQEITIISCQDIESITYATSDTTI